MKQQILIINGGSTFDTYDEYLSDLKNLELDFERLGRKGWKSWLKAEFEETFDIIIPKMPNPNNAKYNEWKIWFEKLIPFLKDDIILIGHSLGGIFLAKYLSENDFPKKIRATYLIAPPYDDKDSEYSLNDFILPKNLKKLSTQSGNVFIYHSKDDPIVPFVDAKKYKERLPKAELCVFRDREHFNQEKFPELLESIEKFS